MKALWYLIVFLVGACVPLQAGLNNRLGKAIGSPMIATLITFLIGAIAVLVYLPFSKESFSWATVKSLPVYLLLGGGVLGALFVTISMLALRHIGMALMFGLLVAGQVIISVLLDHYHVLVAEQHSINLWRILCIAMIIAGVVIVQKF